jgi:hypothetical protein
MKVAESPARSTTAILVVISAAAIVTFAWILNPVAFAGGNWEGGFCIFTAAFYAFFRIRGQDTSLGAVMLTAETSRGVMVFADIVASANLLVGIYVLYSGR